jgi:hypothetical protein
VRIIFAMWRNSFGPGFKIDHNFAERQDYWLLLFNLKLTLLRRYLETEASLWPMKQNVGNATPRDRIETPILGTEGNCLTNWAK